MHVNAQPPALPVVLGVDGGGTKTHYALMRADGSLLGSMSGGPSNHESLARGFSELQELFETVLPPFLSKHGLAPQSLSGAVFGLAGVDTLRQHEIISEMLRDVGFSGFTLCNDAFLGVKSGCPSGAGICAINGTGFSIGGIDHRGRMLQVGGMGDYTGDEGGGGMLKVHVIRCVYEHLYKDAPATQLVGRLFRLIGISDPSDFPEILFREMAEGRCVTRDVLQIAFDAANEGDPVALDLLDRSGNEYARCIQAVARRLDLLDGSDPLEIALAGSLFTRATCRRTAETLEARLREWNPGRAISIERSTADPVSGALLWAMEPFLPKEPHAHASVRTRVLREIRETRGQQEQHGG